MEEERGFAPFGQMNLPKNPFVYRACPPLAAIDRFLMGQENLSYQNQINHTNFNANDDCNSNFSVGFRQGFSNSSTSDDLHVLDNFLENFDENEIQEWAKEPFGDVSTKEGERGKKLVKGGNSMGLIKGQWTEEEDSKLVRLVKQYGIRKWALIADKMVGRAGKQCRERWHNHLRPDIKKDTWNEEEERMLVEAHQSVGNKWAEIAKRIPGRTENSIKNHWNATKRRQNARCKSGNKRVRKNDKSSESSFLQDYIRSQTNPNDETDTTPAMSAISDDPISDQVNQPFPDISSDEISSYIDYKAYDDELNFIQYFFGDDTIANTNITSDQNNAASFPSLREDHEPAKEEAPKKNYIYSDLHISYLLDGGSESTTTQFSLSGNYQENSSIEKKDMDLMEMASQYYFP